MQCRWMMLPAQGGLWTTKRNRAQPVYHTNAMHTMHRSQLRTWKPGLSQWEIPHKSKSFRFHKWRVTELLLLMQMVGWSDQLEAALMKTTLLAAESSLKVFLECWTGWCYEKLTNKYKKYPNMSYQLREEWFQPFLMSPGPVLTIFLCNFLNYIYGSEAIEAIGNCSQSNSHLKTKGMQVFARCCFRSKATSPAIASQMLKFCTFVVNNKKIGEKGTVSPISKRNIQHNLSNHFFPIISSLLKSSNLNPPPPKKTMAKIWRQAKRGLICWMTTGPFWDGWAVMAPQPWPWRPRFVALDLHFLERRGLEVRPSRKCRPVEMPEVLWMFCGWFFWEEITKYAYVEM